MFRYNTAPDYHAERVREERNVSRAFEVGLEKGRNNERERLTRLMNVGSGTVALGGVPEYPRCRVPIYRSARERFLSKEPFQYQFVPLDYWEFEAEQHAVCEGDTTVRWFTWRRVR